MKLTITHAGHKIGELTCPVVPRTGEMLEVRDTVWKVESVCYRFDPTPGADDDLAEIVVRVS